MEGFDGPLLEGEGFVGDGFVEIDADDAAEATAFRAGSEGGIEGEEGWGRGAEGETGFRVGPIRGERTGVFRERDRGVAFSEEEGGFQGFEEAAVVFRGDFEAVLDDLDRAGELWDVAWDLVGAEGFSFDKDAEVALGVQEGE